MAAAPIDLKWSSATQRGPRASVAIDELLDLLTEQWWMVLGSDPG
jgi:hypothetical protein